MNWLITADIHIDDYPSFNFENKSRLAQFDKLADRYKELAVQYDCNVLVMAGDIINRPTNRPYVVVAIHEFLEKISKSFEKVYFILGQHDCDSKLATIQPEDTIMTAFKFPNFEYMDHKILTLPSGKRVGFKDWTIKQDLSWIDTPVDVLIAHYTKSGMFGQEIDESKFGVMLHGDIHNSQEIGKFISIGNPIQHNMSSQARGTCLVMNPEDCSWKRIPVDAEHTRFLRIDYTHNQEEEGFEGPLTYHIYRPLTKSEDVKEFSSQSVKWDEIEQLITNMATERGLGSIHGEVLGKHPEFSEIDFDFKLKSLYIHGYRSIVDFHLDFTGKDRVVLVGSNGSGKSSILRAIRALFDKSRYMPYEQSDFTTDMKVELEFYYQNKFYKLWKGTGWGLEIDGTPVGYNNKTEFENDIVNKLPFLHYMDLFFISSNVSNLSSQFNAERRIELLSKFYRLDRIDAYNITATGLRDSEVQKLQASKDEITKLTGKLDAYNGRIAELSQYEGHTREEYSSVVDNLNDIQSKFNRHKDWESKSREYDSQMLIHGGQLEEYRNRMSINRAEYVTMQETSSRMRKEVEAKLEDLENKRVRFGQLTKDIQECVNKGKELADQVEKLNSGICPICGSRVTNENTEKHKSELTEKLTAERTRYIDLANEFNAIPENMRTPEYYVNEKKRLKALLDEHIKDYTMYGNRISQYDTAKADFDREQKAVDELHEKITSHKLNEPEKAELPIDFQTKLFDATSELAKFDEYKSNIDLKEETEIEIQALKDKNSDIQHQIDEYNRYIALTSHAGDIMKVILDQMAASFTDSSVKYEVEQGVFRNKPYIKFNAFYRVRNKWRIYETLSDGQKCISDLDFLNKLFSLKVGLLVMDESLKHLDFNMGPVAWDIISKMNVNTILIATHDANYATFTRKLMLDLDADGKTVVSMI